MSGSYSLGQRTATIPPSEGMDTFILQITAPAVSI
jgi:hypothetical protein